MSGIDLSYFVDGGGMGLKIFIAGRQNEGGGGTNTSCVMFRELTHTLIFKGTHQR